MFKLNNESVAFVPIPFSSTEVEITSEKEVNNSEGSIDEEKFRMVVKRMASATWVESFFCVRRPKHSRTVDTAKSQWKTEDMSNVSWECGDNGQRQEKHTAKQLQRKFEERATSSRSCCLKKFKEAWMKTPGREFEDSNASERNREEEKDQEELLEDVQDRKKQQEDDRWKELEDYMAPWMLRRGERAQKSGK